MLEINIHIHVHKNFLIVVHVLLFRMSDYTHAVIDLLDRVDDLPVVICISPR